MASDLFALPSTHLLKYHAGLAFLLLLMPGTLLLRLLLVACRCGATWSWTRATR